MNKLIYKNLMRRPARTIGLFLLSFFLGFSLLLGTLTSFGLQNGLKSLEDRLGADIMVVPYEAVSKSKVDEIILQGNTGYFYMNDSLAEKIESREGISEYSEQYFLSSSSSSCCSVKVQIIGFDPDTDFSVTPWLKSTGKKELGEMEVYVGHELNAFPGDTLTFYGSTVTVAARLDETGTYLDTSVYASNDTIRKIVEYSESNQIYSFGNRDPYTSVSAVLINVADGYTVEDVVNDINIHVRGVEAIQMNTLVSDVAGRISGIANLLSYAIIGIWLLVLVILFLVFSMITRERSREYAVYRVLGMSKGELFKMVFSEAFIIGLIGSIVGALFSALISMLFSNSVTESIGLPFLIPSGMSMIVIFLISILVSVLCASLAAVMTARKGSQVDASLVLRVQA